MELEACPASCLEEPRHGESTSAEVRASGEASCPERLRTPSSKEPRASGETSCPGGPRHGSVVAVEARAGVARCPGQPRLPGQLSSAPGVSRLSRPESHAVPPETRLHPGSAQVRASDASCPERAQRAPKPRASGASCPGESETPARGRSKPWACSASCPQELRSPSVAGGTICRWSCKLNFRLSSSWEASSRPQSSSPSARASSSHETGSGAGGCTRMGRKSRRR